MSENTEPSPLFEIHHGSTVIRIEDDWSGHVLIEQLYDGLRRARRASGGVGAQEAPPADDGAQMIELALSHGFRQVGENRTYQATAEQIAALIDAVQERERQQALLDGHRAARS